jgi:secondary thiamine-phosphate synthase enzyme
MTPFKVVNVTLTFSTEGEVEFIDLSDRVQQAVSSSGVEDGIAHVFAPHATGLLVLTENDPALLNDIRNLLDDLTPKSKKYNHPSNAHAHLRSILLPPDKTLPLINGIVKFGTWQSLMFVETDVHSRRRTVFIQVIGET